MVPALTVRLKKILFALLLATAHLLHAEGGEDLDVYKIRMQGTWWFSSPTGSFQGKADSGSFDLSRDFRFGSYSTFSGRLDWRFKRKHHLILGINPVTSSRTTTISRAVEFQGITYDVGARVSSEIDTLSFSPGYQYDLIRRNRGYLAIATQVYLLNTKASLTGTASVNGVSTTRTASGSFFAPCPVTGLQGRLYWLRNSRRLSVDGSAQGMSFFGYGNFVTARGTFAVAMSRHWNLLMGYQVGTRLSIHGDTNRIGIRLVQKGPVVGLETSW